MAFYKRISRSFTKNILVKEDDHKSIQKFIEESPDADYYDSIYLYTESHKEQFERTRSLAGITDVKTNRIIFDLDSKEDLEKARKDALLLCSRLLSEGMEDKNIQLYFSGNKGYHVELFTDQYYSRKEIENILNHYAGDLVTVDFKITDEQRVIRTALTKHPKTGLYKIPVSMFELELVQSSDINLEAQNVLPKHYNLINSYSILTPPDRINKIKTKDAVQQKQLEQIEILSDRPDFSKKPKFLSAVKYALSEGYFEPGERHNAFMILASSYRALNFNKEIAYNMLKATNRLQSRRTGQEPFSTDELWINVIEYVYSPKWRGGTFSEEEDLLLRKVKQRLNIADTGLEKERQLVSLAQVIDGFDEFATNIDKNTIKMGLVDLDKNVRLTTNMLVSLLGAPGAAKTSFSFRFLNYINSIDEHAVMFSLDMSSQLVFQRLLQKHTGKTSDQIFDIYKNNKVKEKEQFKNILQKEYSNVKFCFESGMDCDAIRDRLLQLSQEGVRPKVIVIDYLECITTHITDSTQSKAYVALRLKDIANEFNTCVLLLTQPVKVAGDPRYPLNSYTDIKGSGVIAEQSSIVLTIHRPGFSPTSPEDDNFVSITVVKNRMGQLGQYDYGWEGLTGAVMYLTEEQREDLKRLRTQVQAEDDGI